MDTFLLQWQSSLCNKDEQELNPQAGIQYTCFPCALFFADSGGFGFNKPKNIFPVFEAPGATVLAKGLHGQIA